jgi:hypothetical protein
MSEMRMGFKEKRLQSLIKPVVGVLVNGIRSAMIRGRNMSKFKVKKTYSSYPLIDGCARQDIGIVDHSTNI